MELPIAIEKGDCPAWLVDIVGIDFTSADSLVPPHKRLIRALGAPLPSGQAWSPLLLCPRAPRPTHPHAHDQHNRD